MPNRSLIFTASPFAKADIQLGSLIPDRAHPDIDAFTPITPQPSDISCNEDGDFVDSWNTQSSAAFTATLSKLFSASFSHNPSTKVEIVAAPNSDGLKSIVYKLKNPKALFKEMCKTETVLEWLEEGYKTGEQAWLVVEYRSLVNAAVTLSAADSKGMSGEAALPVFDLAGGPVPGDIANVGMEGMYERSNEKTTTFVAKEERVFAVGCRKVSVRPYRWSNIDPTLGQEIRWKSALTRTESQGQAQETMMMAGLDDEIVDDEEVFDAGQKILLGNEIFLKLS